MIAESRRQATFLLSAVEFDVCWELLGLGETPVQLGLPSPGRTRTERRRVVGAAEATLTARGLFPGREPAPALGSALELLAAGEWLVDARLALPEIVDAIGAGRASEGAVAARRGDRVWLAALEDHQVIPELLGLAGDVPPGVGESASVRVVALTAAARIARGDPQLLAAELTARGERAADAAELARLSAGPIRQGQFGASAVTTSGRRRATRVVSFHDTAAGRHLQLRRGTGDQEWVTITPADNRKIAAALRELAAEAR
ncbi:ESX secretion-associated protein EspG [Actinoalloteichus fjordicus]|uniref:EspG family n=1 Tax=Actinoalloteichus fjordicus TaxID=1612552 RepID=A0AAC9L9T8_9PSEU|nr:ESX secretion-associated protein EspG [Actinoalloteichus fjordicus]APU12984.1 EspG family [Actinoalloteichus fjordicus]